MALALDADRVIKANTRIKEISGSGYSRVETKNLKSV